MRAWPEKWRPWVAMALPALAWMGFEYGAGSTLRGACAAIGDWLGPAWGLLSLLACGVAMGVAWPLARGGEGADPPTGSWLARIALFTAAIFALAISFQTLATMIVPPCVQ